MLKTTIYYYINPTGENLVSDFLDSLRSQQQAKLLRIVKTIQAYGLSSVMSHLKKLTNTPFWEIRVLGKDNTRVIYFLIDKTAIVLLHGFIKKSQKTSKKNLSIAIKRYNDWKYRSAK